MPRLKVKTSARLISAAGMRARIEKGNYKALRFAARDVWQAAKRGIGQKEPKQTKAGEKKVGAGAVIEIMGGLYRDLTMLSSGKPRAAGKPIKSWSPKRFMYNSLFSYWDNSRKSAIIGPYRGHGLARLHQFGGTLRLTAYSTGARQALQAKQESLARGQNGGRGRDGKFLARQKVARKNEYGAIIWSHKTPRNAKNWDRTSLSKNARYPARPFMRGSAGVERVIERIRLRFRNTLPIGGRAA
jgi:hypothetical protein